MSEECIKPQHHISELITILERIKSDHGDLPIVYWDNRWTVTFEDFEDQALWLVRGHLYFGGFSREGSEFNRHDPVITN